MMAIPDVLYLALIAIALSLEHLVLWPAFVRRSRADPARARSFLWSGWMIVSWTLVAAGALRWSFAARAAQTRAASRLAAVGRRRARRGARGRVRAERHPDRAKSAPNKGQDGELRCREPCTP